MRTFIGGGKGNCLASLAIDVSTLEPYMSCGQPINKAQGSALGALALNPLTRLTPCRGSQTPRYKQNKIAYG